MWHFIKKYILQPLFLISFGGMAYFNFEILFRGYSHISMIICGGLCFYTIGLLNEGKNWHPSFLFQMILGSLIIITYEYLTGVIVNIYLNLHVWDYSKVPFNYRGQICIPFLICAFVIGINFARLTCSAFSDHKFSAFRTNQLPAQNEFLARTRSPRFECVF